MLLAAHAARSGSREPSNAQRPARRPRRQALEARPQDARRRRAAGPLDDTIFRETLHPPPRAQVRHASAACSRGLLHAAGRARVPRHPAALVGRPELQGTKSACSFAYGARQAGACPSRARLKRSRPALGSRAGVARAQTDRTGAEGASEGRQAGARTKGAEGAEGALFSGGRGSTLRPGRGRRGISARPRRAAGCASTRPSARCRRRARLPPAAFAGRCATPRRRRRRWRTSSCLAVCLSSCHSPEYTVPSAYVIVPWPWHFSSCNAPTYLAASAPSSCPGPSACRPATRPRRRGRWRTRHRALPWRSPFRHTRRREHRRGRTCTCPVRFVFAPTGPRRRRRWQTSPCPARLNPVPELAHVR